MPEEAIFRKTSVLILLLPTASWTLREVIQRKAYAYSIPHRVVRCGPDSKRTS